MDKLQILWTAKETPPSFSLRVGACTHPPTAEKEMEAKKMLLFSVLYPCLALGFWVSGFRCQPGGGGVGGEVARRVLRWPLGKEMEQVKIIILPDCVATCFGCGPVRTRRSQRMSFDVRVKRFGGILGRRHAALRWDLCWKINNEKRNAWFLFLSLAHKQFG